MNKMNITGEEILKARMNAGMTQKQLSEKLMLKGIPICRGSVSRIEHGRREVKDYELDAIAEILKINHGAFFVKGKRHEK